MNDIFVVKLPKPNGKITGLWCYGYPVHQGNNPDSLNYATLFAHQNGIVPDQEKLKDEYNNFLETLRKAGFKLHYLDFPKNLNLITDLHHDAIFIRDSGMFFKNYWLKSNFSAKVRQAEAEAHALAIAKKFKKKIINMPQGAYMEFGEVSYFKTADGDYYFGGLARANKKGHDFVRKIIKPKHYYLIKSHGYHMDTVLTPVIDKKNILVAIVAAKEMLTTEGLKAVKKINKPIIFVDRVDSSGEGDDLGNYAVNALVAPGVMVNAAKFKTPGVEEKLKSLGIKHYVCPLTYFRFAGGSCHCLTNELN